MPHAIFVACVWALLRADAFSGHGRWGDAVPHTLAGIAGAAFGICSCAAVLGLLLHPFQIRAVRMLEGYWGRWTATARLAGVMVRYQRRRRRSLEAIVPEATVLGADLPVSADERDPATPPTESPSERGRRAATAREWARADGAHRLAALPPSETLLPTALGNALRAGELRAGERYGLTTLTSWPRIYPQMSRPLAAVVSSARDTLDTAVNLCYSFSACGVVSGAAVLDEPGMWWLPAGSLGAAALAYKGAVTAAQGYAHLMHVVYDLHRFDLVRAMHHPLPDREGEWDLFQRISDALADRAADLPYDHGRPGQAETGGTA
ncbi:hypothetical protein [Actinomadura sp. GC306]|uniref:hypothetical protein n=1 Tax=Actinomadura sp. GC306 TaxID=2530367 RepID=UPI001A9CCAF7|nr:hypothetical protein [Actinomadura sp. GC306]